jgi:hypothetical protein
MKQRECEHIEVKVTKKKRRVRGDGGVDEERRR